MNGYSDELAYIRSKIGEQRREILEHMGWGNAKSYEEYSKLVGIILGLDRAEQIIIDLQARNEDDDDGN